jgi:hypothetical protein
MFATIAWAIRTCDGEGLINYLDSTASHRDSRLLQIARRRLAAHVHRLLNPPQRPAQPPQRYHLLFLFLAQDVTHIAEGIALSPFNVPNVAYIWPVFR